MKRAKLLIVGLVVALCMSLALCGCSSSEYSPEKKKQSVESSALKADGKLRVGVDSSNAPYAVFSSGSMIGLEVDIAAALADEMGLELELVDIGSDVVKGITTENVDVVMGATADNEAYWKSKPYMTTAVCLFSSEATAKAPTDLTASFKIAAQASSMSAWEVNEHYGETHLTSASNLNDAFAMLPDSKAEYVASDVVIGSYAAHSSKVSAFPIATLGDKTDRCVAVAAKNTALQKAVDAAIESISKGGLVSVIEKKWLGTSINLSGLEAVTVMAQPAEEETEATEETTNGNKKTN